MQNLFFPYLEKKMSNSSFNSSSLSLLTIDAFLDALGYTPWLTILSTFVLPVISFIGAILCSLSAFIFLQPKFKDPVFFFYQLLCLVYIVHLIHNLPNGLLFSLRYYPQIDTYWSSAIRIGVDTYWSSTYILPFYLK